MQAKTGVDTMHYLVSQKFISWTANFAEDNAKISILKKKKKL